MGHTDPPDDTDTGHETDDRPPAADARRTLAEKQARLFARIPGGGLFIRIMHLNVKLFYPFVKLLGRVTRQREMVRAWIQESEDVFAVYYAAAAGEDDSGDVEQAG